MKKQQGELGAEREVTHQGQTKAVEAWKAFGQIDALP